MRILILGAMLALIAGCVIIGTKSALQIDSNGWQLEGREYVYRGHDVIVAISEIVVSEHESAVGIIFPIIPGSGEHNAEAKNLSLRVTILGYPNDTANDPKMASILANISGKPSQPLESSASKISSSTSNNAAHRLWMQYGLSYTYDVHLGELNDVSLDFVLPMFNDKVPPLKLTRRTVNNNQFILTPGT